MWVRSQDKQILGNFKHFKIQRNLRKYTICTCDTSDSYILGEYDSFDSAISVLDTIQDILSKEDTTIFQMPN